MEQEDGALSHWQAAQHRLPEDTEINMSPSPGSNGVQTSWNNGPPGAHHTLQCPQLERIPLVSAGAPQQSENEMGPQFSMLLPEHCVNYCPEVTLLPSQMIYCPSQPGMMIFKRPQMMSLGEANIPGVAMTFGGNLRMSPIRPPVTAPSGIPMMSHIRAPMTPYSGFPAVPSNRDSLTPKMLSAPTMPSAEGQPVLPSLAEMLPPRDSHNSGMSPAGSPSLLALESQDSSVSQPASQEDPSLPEQPTPAPRRAGENCRARGGAPKRRFPIARPYYCQYEDCGKAYTKRSHLVSHQRKHTGERPYKCPWDGCTWSFFRSDELGRHQRIHTRYRPYRCDQCGRQFMRSDHLRQHRRTHLRNEQMAGPPAPGL